MADATSLLLLPALDLVSSPSSFRSSYKSTLESLLPRLRPQDKTSVTRLDVGLVLSATYPLSTHTCRSAIFVPIQNLLKQAYSLITSVASQQNVDLDFPGGIDIRVFILDPRVDLIPQNLVGKQPLSGPIVDIDTFVLSDRSYKTIYSVEGETGEAHLKQFLTTWGSKLKDEPPPSVRLPSGPAIVSSSASASQPLSTSEGVASVTSHASVAVGGTFDHLHIGHKLLLTGTILTPDPGTASRLITVGITGDELLVNKKYGSHVESWSARQERTADFVDSILAFYPRKTSPNSGANGLRTTEYIDNPGPNGKVVRVIYKSPQSSSGVEESITVNYTQISDPFGPTITDPDISALVISAETRAGGKAVNDKRKEKGWKELEVFEVGILDAGVGLEDEEEMVRQRETFDSKISSTEIRRRLQERSL
ncbi:pantetheine-phosphate adenylyltransferase family protein [Cladophialophora carrionii]|uniref:Pantetheine-phosphate adenylyltransferase family protein n=1 Tax=Cladophialophora carrionii TaxID=86049 RepID=A0A1C1CC14_9EURO|nr:pantetheine-phosphate adenylyltransferase family protein [Cladophialophora carrionii]